MLNFLPVLLSAVSGLSGAGTFGSHAGTWTTHLFPSQAPAPLPLGCGADLEELAAALRSQHPRSRCSALRKLAAEGSPAAWRLVLEGLDDPLEPVADEAQWLLGELPDLALVRRLVSAQGLESRRSDLRLRAAEVLGRLTVPVDGERASRVLSSRRPELASQLCWSLERLERRGLLLGDRAKIARRIESLLGRSGSDRLRADALACLARVHPGRAERHLRSALRPSSRLLPRIAALTAIDQLGWQESYSLLVAASADEDPSIRSAAYRLLSARARLSVLEVLVDRLELESRVRLQGQLLRSLRTLTGMRHGADPRPWRAWLADQRQDWIPVDAVPPSSQGRTVSTRIALRCLSDRLAVLIDFSGSLWAERGSGLTRKDLLERALEQFLREMDPDVQFNLVTR